jgi:hypothetical protein
MTRLLLIFLIVSLLIACNTKVETKQWNLNQTIGWKRDNPNEFAILFTKADRLPTSIDQKADKRRFDEAVLQELKTNRIGDQTDNDEPSAADFHFVVDKDYRKAITAILLLAKTYKLQQHITVYKRDYHSEDKWTDKVVYPK